MSRKSKPILSNRAPLIEALEGRRLLTIFANGIDSNNLGEGVWAWGLRSAMSNLGYGSNYASFFNYVHNTQGAQYIIIKAADGGSVYNNPAGQQSYTSAVRDAAHAAGLKIMPYFYIRGTDAATTTAEINVFNSIVSSVGADGVVFDIEGDWASGATSTVRDQRIVDYFNGIGKSQAGDGSGARDSMFMAYSSFPYVSLHGEDPFLKLGDYCDASMPQPYWAVLKNSPSSSSCRSPTKGQSLTGVGGPTRMVTDVDSEYRMMSLESTPRANIWNGHPESVKPVIMTGQMYGNATASEITEFYDAVKNDVTAVGPGNVAGYRYKSINFFDEDTSGVTTQAQRDALNARSIGDLPGTPSTPAPANNATLSTSPTTLDWADVVNTYGAGSVGAATSYDVYIDGVLKSNVTASQYTVTTTLAPGAHTWQVKANDIFGATAGPTWTFNITGGPVAAPTNLAVSTYSSNSVSLAWTDNSNNESQFLIERRTGLNGTFAQIGTSSANVASYTDNTAQPNTVYGYQVRAWDGVSVYSGYASAVAVTTLAATPTGLAASDGLFNNKVALTWNAAAGATAYQLYRNTVNDSSSATPFAAPASTSFDDTTATPNTTYFYWVASYNADNVPSPKSAVNSGFIDAIAPTISSRSFQGQFGLPYVAFTFSEPVTIGIDNVTFTNLDVANGPVPSAASFQYIAGSDTAKFFLNADLPDGNFRATVNGVTDAAGNAVPDSNTVDFYFLRGDANADRVVNALDFNALANHFGFSGAGFAGGDFDFDGTVTTNDFAALAQHWAVVVPAPMPAAAASRVAPPSLFSQTPLRSKNSTFTDLSYDNGTIA